jgi:hypothetical protein
MAASPLGTAGAYLGAIVVHPTNALLAPVLAGPFLARGGVALREQGAGAARHLLRMQWPLALLLLAGGAALLAPRGGLPAAPVGGRLLDAAQWGRFAGLYGDLLSGLTTYRYVAGEPSARMARLHAYGLAVALAAVLGLGARGVWRRRDPNELGVVLGTLAMTALFFALAGPEALRPHRERFGLCLVAPTVLSLSFFLAPTPASPSRRTRLRLLLAAAGALLLASFAWNHLRELRTTGGRSHPTFRTGPAEPKQAALARALAAAPGRPVSIAAEGWWIYWPVRYLAAAHPSVSVQLVQGHAEASAALARGSFVAAFPGSDADRGLQREGVSPASRAAIPSYGGDPALVLWHPAAPAEVP